MRREASFSVLTSAIVLLLIGVWAGCAATDQAQRADQGDWNAISTEQVVDFLSMRPGASAFEIVRQLRPTWLTRRSAGTNVWVYEGTLRAGEASRYLRGVDLASVSHMRYLGSNEANLRFGRGHEEGVILLYYR